MFNGMLAGLYEKAGLDTLLAVGGQVADTGTNVYPPVEIYVHFSITCATSQDVVARLHGRPGIIRQYVVSTSHDFPFDRQYLAVDV